MTYEEICDAVQAGGQSPSLVMAAFAIGEAKMALEVADGTSWRYGWAMAPLPRSIKTVSAVYTVHGEARNFTGTFVLSYVEGTDLCEVIEAPAGAQFSDDRLNKLVIA